MGCYLNDVFTDTGAIPAILAYLDEHPRSIVPEFADGPSSFQHALEAMHINLSLIDDRHVPTVYQGNIYRWLENDVLELFSKLGLLQRQEDVVGLTDFGKSVLREQLRMIDVLAAGIYNWTEQARTGASYRPVIALLDLLQQLYEKQLPPCPGLMLPEAVLVLKMVYWGEELSVCLDRIYAWREEAMASIPATDTAAFDDEDVTRRASVCVHLADFIKPKDVCRVRATLIHIIGGALAAYGDLYGRVQYITHHSGLHSRLRECQSHPGGRLELAQSLSWSEL